VLDGSRSDPAIWPVDWNRSFHLEAALATGGRRGVVLLLHGLTDAPYSLRSIGEHLAAGGFEVVGLRLPGHGTAPSGLVTFRVEDMQAAVRMAMLDLRRQAGPDLPIYMVGYSNGAARAVDYTLSILEGEALPKPAGLVLISPSIGITRLAGGFAHQFRILAHGFGLRPVLRRRDLARAILLIQPRQALLILLRHLFRSGGGIVQIARDFLCRLDALGSAGFASFKAEIAFRHRHARSKPNQRADPCTDQCILPGIAPPKSRRTRRTHRRTRQRTRRCGLIPALRLLAHGLLLSRQGLATCADIGVLAGRQQQG
jgi:pimeloyl-ACP methyl ester carboxylesterase